MPVFYSLSKQTTAHTIHSDISVLIFPGKWGTYFSEENDSKRIYETHDGFFIFMFPNAPPWVVTNLAIQVLRVKFLLSTSLPKLFKGGLKFCRCCLHSAPSNSHTLTFFVYKEIPSIGCIISKVLIGFLLPVLSPSSSCPPFQFFFLTLLPCIWTLYQPLFSDSQQSFHWIIRRL